MHIHPEFVTAAINVHVTTSAGWEGKVVALGALGELASGLGVIFLWLNLRTARQAQENAYVEQGIAFEAQDHDRTVRQREWTGAVFQRWYSDPMVEARRALEPYKTKVGLARSMKAAFRNDEQRFLTLFRLPGFFQEVAWLDESGLLEHEKALELWGSLMSNAWNLFEDAIAWFRTTNQFGVENTSAFATFERVALGYRMELGANGPVPNGAAAPAS